MRVLAVETSGPKGSLALGHFVGGRLKSSHHVQWEKKAIHSEMATIQLQELVRLAGVSLEDLTHFVVNVGPGSFTGIRVGLNLAKSLAYAFAKPIAPVTSLQLLAAKLATEGKVFVALKAIQDFYYAAQFEMQSEGPKILMAPASVEGKDLHELSRDSTIVGIEGQTTGFDPSLTATDSLQILDRCPETFQFSSWKEVRPVYIRASEAEEKLLKGLLKREF